MEARAASLHLVRAIPLRPRGRARTTPAGALSGLLHAQPCATATLTLPTPWRQGVLCAWREPGDVQPVPLWGHEVPPALTLVPRQVRGVWRDVRFVAQPGEDDELVSFVYGRVRPRHAARFFATNVRVAAAGRSSPGFLHGMGLFESPLRFASFTRWRSADDLRAYAYGPGRHRDAVRPYKAVPWATEHAAVRFGVVRP